MVSEKLLSFVVEQMNRRYLNMKSYEDQTLPGPEPGKHYLLYIHIPFCESLCPYCSFNRYPFEEKAAREYFGQLRTELKMLRELGFDFESMYVGGGTPTILPHELAKSIVLARELFSIREVSCETNPNHLCPDYLEPLKGMVDRMSVGVQSFDDGLLRQMCRYDKYGSARQIRERIEGCVQEGWFRTLNVDMIFNFPAQTEEMLLRDVSVIRQCGCNQATFYPLMASPSVQQSLKDTVGVVDSTREQCFYEILCRELTRDGAFAQASAWAFNRDESGMIDEYVVDYEEYVAAGSGGMSFVGRELLVNTFGLKEYRGKILSGRRSVSGCLTFSRRDHMRYRLMMQLFGLKLDKKTWKRDFGCSVPAGLPAEYFFLKCVGALQETDSYITLTEKGRYLLLAMMRQFFIGVNTVRDRERDKLCQN